MPISIVSSLFFGYTSFCMTKERGNTGDKQAQTDRRQDVLSQHHACCGPDHDPERDHESGWHAGQRDGGTSGNGSHERRRHREPADVHLQSVRVRRNGRHRDLHGAVPREPRRGRRALYVPHADHPCGASFRGGSGCVSSFRKAADRFLSASGRFRCKRDRDAAICHELSGGHVRGASAFRRDAGLFHDAAQHGGDGGISRETGS